MAKLETTKDYNEVCWNTGIYLDMCNCEECSHKDECSGYDGEEDEEFVDEE